MEFFLLIIYSVQQIFYVWNLWHSRFKVIKQEIIEHILSFFVVLIENGFDLFEDEPFASFFGFKEVE